MKVDSPSSTALAVCVGVAARGLAFPGSVDPQVVQLSLASVKIAKRSLYWFVQIVHKLGLLKPVIELFEFFSIRGITEHFVLRKAAIRKHAEKAAQSCEQIVILGGGYDFLSHHLAVKHPNLKVFETDHPATQAVKKRIYNGTKPPVNLYLVPIDYTKSDLETELVRLVEFQSCKRTLLIAEGLFMYLTQSQIERIFATRAKLIFAQSPFIFTTMVINQNEKRIRFQTQSWLLELWMNLRGEPFLSGFTRDDLQLFVTKMGCKITSIDDHLTMPGKGVARGEIVVCVE